MKTPSKIIVLLFAAVLLFSACELHTHDPSAELATLPIYKFAQHQPAKAVSKNTDQSITGILTHWEIQLDRMQNFFSTTIGMPHQAISNR